MRNVSSKFLTENVQSVASMLPNEHPAVF